MKIIYPKMPTFLKNFRPFLSTQIPTCPQSPLPLNVNSKVNKASYCEKYISGIMYKNPEGNMQFPALVCRRPRWQCHAIQNQMNFIYDQRLIKTK